MAQVTITIADEQVGRLATAMKALYPIPAVYSDTTASASNMYIDSAGQLFRSTSSRGYKDNIN